MSTYNVNRFTPGNKANMRLFMNKIYLRQYYSQFLTNQTFQNINNADDITEGTLCGCLPQQANKTKQGWNNPMQTENTRMSRILTGTLGGKITYGNLNKPVKINYLGSWEGQPGGSKRPLRNKF